MKTERTLKVTGIASWRRVWFGCYSDRLDRKSTKIELIRSKIAKLDAVFYIILLFLSSLSFYIKDDKMVLLGWLLFYVQSAARLISTFIYFYLNRWTTSLGLSGNPFLRGIMFYLNWNREAKKIGNGRRKQLPKRFIIAKHWFLLKNASQKSKQKH